MIINKLDQILAHCRLPSTQKRHVQHVTCYIFPSSSVFMQKHDRKFDLILAVV